MAVEGTSAWQRAAAFLATIIVRVWPNQTKQWGRAFKAELAEITDPLASLRWLLGGLMLLTREWWRSFFEGLGRPIGVLGGPAEISSKNWTRVPRTPLWATVLLVLGSGGILMHPEVRGSLSSVLGNYINPERDPSRWRSVKKLRREAETNRDPQLLAWLSLLSTDPAERLRLSGEAIEKDPSLTWLDFEQSLLPLNDLSQQHYFSNDRITRLQRWDPDNSIPRLLAAEVISNPLRSEAFQSLISDGTKIEWETKIVSDSRWLAQMEQAFSAPKYDSYVLKEFQLARAVSNKYGIEDPDQTLYVLAQARLIQFEMLNAYANYLLDVGAQAEQLGNLPTAESAYWKILRFSERVCVAQSLPIEKMFATSMGIKVGARLQPLLKRAGRADEAILLGFQVAEWVAWRDQSYKKAPVLKNEHWKTVGRDGLTIQAITFVVVLLSSVFVVSQIVVWLGRRTPIEQRARSYSFFCRMADIGPLLIVVSSVVLFLAYHPYAQAYKNCLSQSFPDMETLFVAGSVTRVVPPDLLQYRVDPGFFFWTAVTVGLTLVVALLSFRMLTQESVTRLR